MRIAYVLNTYPAPSHSFIRREIRALERRGITVYRIAMRPHGEPLADAGDREEAALTEYVLAAGIGALLGGLLSGLRHQPLGLMSALGLTLRLGWPSEAGLFRHLIYWLEAAYLTRRARILGVERLHAHFGTNATTVAMLAQEMGAPPFSLTVHGPEEFDKPGLIGLTQKLERADFVVGVSSYGWSQLSRWISPCHWSKLHVVHCGIEPERFPYFEPVPESRPLQLICIGRLAEQKGHLVLIEAMAAVARRGVEARLVLVGDGPLRSLIEQAIAKFELGETIRLAGWLDEDSVRAEIAAAHGMVLPSFAEGLPVVLMEAMVSARPVIATWIAGIPELVQPGKNGWLVPPGDPQGLAEAILDLAATSQKTLVQMGKNARTQALSRHSIDTEAGKLAQLFAQRPRPQPD
ncbi:glycosyltransferase [Synechococcales cyanobacterium C]|uniref:Glycosyltransferase n=1 Tax=Petrachloros mirabilis ULC683 TaxID=2781853 RepID=A0A8K1ZWY7_9CYAN|nr:glycosyltransferase [Petrachloros mirabilis]NCJ05638.1 glycosyltransferase [Petrachloros mirabilis ULC683]